MGQSDCQGQIATRLSGWTTHVKSWTWLGKYKGHVAQELGKSYFNLNAGSVEPALERAPWPAVVRWGGFVIVCNSYIFYGQSVFCYLARSPDRLTGSSNSVSRDRTCRGTNQGFLNPYPFVLIHLATRLGWVGASYGLHRNFIILRWKTCIAYESRIFTGRWVGVNGKAGNENNQVDFITTKCTDN